MADSGESEEENEKLRASVLETANAIFQIRLRAEQEVRRANEILEERTRELSRALVVMRATLESTETASFSATATSGFPASPMAPQIRSQSENGRMR